MIRPSAYFASRADGMAEATQSSIFIGRNAMNLAFWMPFLFALGLGSLVLCLLFVDACERI
ncbi:hypothetical protein GQ57_15040 [Burkholderia sp. MSh2]|nr:hypothetical protein GQ57_15040 [Burkholderia sp. MSh2]KFG92340.1 hypothetical protein GQ56_0137870 [Burkholderia paludis]